jgi:SAM-dependent methyltransferase
MMEGWAAWRSFALIAAMQLDLFTHIANGSRTAADVARAAGASERGTRGLLDSLVGLGFLKKAATRYALTPVAATYLTRTSDLYMEGGDRIAQMLAEDWANLADAVRSGAPHLGGRTPEQLAEFWPLLVKQIFPMNYPTALAAARALTKRERARIRRILDIGAGAGPWSIGFATVLKDARVTAVDLPVVTPITRAYAERFGVADRFEYRDGDFHSVDFGRDEYNLAILGHIIHGEGERASRVLLKRIADALVAGGMLLIAEFMPNDQRTGPPLALLFGLNMLLHAPDGDVFTLAEMRSWLKEAGFRKVKTMRAPAPSPLIFATK